MENSNFRLRVLPLSSLTPIPLNPPERTLDARLKGLRVEILKTKLIIPPLVATDPKDNKNRFWIVDGNRRFTIAKELKISSLACNVIECPSSRLGLLFLSINTQMKFTGFQKLWLMKNSNIFATEKERAQYNWALDVGGHEMIDAMIENRNALPTTISWTKKVAQYTKLWPQKEDIRKVMFWLVDLKMAYRSRIAYNAHFSRNAWRSLILEHQPLPFGNT